MAKQKLEIDMICDMLCSGDTFTQVAQKLETPATTLHDFTTRTPERFQKTQTALRISADAYVTLAIDALDALNNASTVGEIAKAKGLAVHYRWLASKRNPAVYNDRLNALLANAEVKSKRKTIIVELQNDDPAPEHGTTKVKSLNTAPVHDVPFVEVPNSLNASHIYTCACGEQPCTCTQEFTGET